ncbi:MAG: hypothetical protein ABR575_05220 [Actinomycetota bacterium]
MTDEAVPYEGAPSHRPDPGAGADPRSVEAGSRRRAVPVLVAGLVLAGALAATFALLWAQSKDAQPSEVTSFLAGERDAAETRATEVITLLMNYDSTNLDQRAAQIRELATGTFRDQYDRLVSQGLGKALASAAASSRGQIVEGPDVSFRSSSEAVALARVSQTTQSTDNPEGRTFLYVLKVILVKTQDGGWLADQVEILSEQSA